MRETSIIPCCNHKIRLLTTRGSRKACDAPPDPPVDWRGDPLQTPPTQRLRRLDLQEETKAPVISYMTDQLLPTFLS